MISMNDLRKKTRTNLDVPIPRSSDKARLRSSHLNFIDTRILITSTLGMTARLRQPAWTETHDHGICTRSKDTGSADSDFDMNLKPRCGIARPYRGGHAA